MSALIDVNDAFDGSFLDTVDVDRITEIVDQYGRVKRYKQRFSNVAAVVTATGPSDLQRLPDFEMMNRSISLYCPQFRLQGPVRDPQTGLGRTQPDEIHFHGSTFVVFSVNDYSGYGRGFTSAIAVSIDAVDGPPLGGSVGRA